MSLNLVDPRVPTSPRARRTSRPFTLLAALAVAAGLGCNAPLDSAVPVVAGGWMTQCPTTAACLPTISLQLIQLGDSVLGSATVIVEQDGLGRQQQDRTQPGGTIPPLVGKARGERLTLNLRLTRTLPPDFRPDTAAATLTARLSNASVPSSMQVTLVVQPSASKPGYTVERRLVPIGG